MCETVARPSTALSASGGGVERCDMKDAIVVRTPALTRDSAEALEGGDSSTLMWSCPYAETGSLESEKPTQSS